MMPRILKICGDMIKNTEIAIVIPSYKEVENISVLIKRIFKELPQAKVVIVDDSPLKENEKIKELTKNYKNTKLISRFKKAGRGSAVLDGFKKVLKDKGVNYIFEMDSDLAHDPSELERFIDEMNVYPYDLVIGSRYKSGGKIINIPYNRTIMSRIINHFLYIWFGIKISDYTSGFRLYSRKAISFINKSKMKSKGFITLSEIVYKLHKSGFTISEVPITWNYRVYGKSNVNMRELLTSLLFVIRLRF